MASLDQKPLPGDYAPFYDTYVRLVPAGQVLDLLEKGQLTFSGYLASLKPDQWDYRYAEGKWSVREVLLHLIDSERIFAYRALRIGRNDQTPLPGFDQDIFVEYSDASARSESSLLEEYQSVRQATLSLFRGFPAEAWARRGYANAVEVSAHAIPFIIAGHEIHHLNVLQNRYFPS